MAAHMVCAYYGKGAENEGLFESLKLAHEPASEGKPWDHCLGKFDAIRLTMTNFFNENAAYDAERGEALIPNKEILAAFQTSAKGEAFETLIGRTSLLG